MIDQEFEQLVYELLIKPTEELIKQYNQFLAFS